MIGIGLGLYKRRLHSANSPSLPFDIFVDSVLGNDSNSGASPERALRTLAAALSLGYTGVRIGLARRSFWRETFDLSSISHPIVSDYGSGSPPKISGADIITSWSKTSGLTNVYEKLITHNAASTNRLTAYEDDILLTRVADAATCDSTVGSFVKILGSSGSPVLIKIHPSDSGNPNSNGKTYEVTTRVSALTGLDNTAVSGIQTEKAISNNGSTDFVGKTNVSIKRILSKNGTKHNIGTGSGTIEDCIAYLADNIIDEELSNTSFVAYLNDASGQNVYAVRCGVVGNCPGVDWITHGSPTGFDSSNAIQLWAVNTNAYISSWTTNVGSFYKGVQSIPLQTGSVDKIIVDLTSGTSGASVPGYYSDMTITDSVIKIVQRTSNDEIIRISGTFAVAFQNVSMFCDTSLVSGGGTSWFANGTSSQNVTMNKCVVFNGVNSMQLASGGSYVGNYNVYISGYPNQTWPVVFQHYIAGYCLTLAAWQAASGQDAQSVYLARVDQSAGNPYAFWLGVANNTDNGPKDNNWRINPNARVYSAANVAYIGTFPDGTLITTAGAQNHWDWNARASASGPPASHPNVPASLTDAQNYISSPTTWVF